MKKIVLVLFLLLLCIGVCACNIKVGDLIGRPSADNTPTNPIIGTWEVKATDLEQSFTFQESANGTEGVYKCYDYNEGKWHEFAFTVKEQTDVKMILLIEEGTIQELNYIPCGDYLYLNGIFYANASVEMPSLKDIPGRIMLMNGAPYDIYEGLFLGMYADDVQNSLDTELELIKGSERDDYKYTFDCDYYCNLSVKGDYYSLRLGFDENKQLVHLTKQGSYNAARFGNLYNSLSQEFGPPSISERKYEPEHTTHQNIKEFTWETGVFTIEISTYTDVDKSIPEYVTATYYYEPSRDTSNIDVEWRF